MSRPSHSLLPIILLVALGMSWGLRVSIIKFAAESGIAYPTIAAATTLGVTLTLLLVNVARCTYPRFGRQRLGFYLTCAALGYVAPFFLQLSAAPRIAATTFALVVSTAPVITWLMAAALGHERATPSRLLGLALGMAAVGVLLVPELAGSGAGAALGILIALAVPLSYSTYHIFVARRWPAGLDSFQVASGEVTVAFVLLLPVHLWFGAELPFVGPWGTGEWSILALIGLITVDTYLYFEVIRLAGPVFAAQGNFVMVVAGVIWGLLLFGEQPGPWLWLSLALLLAALFALTRPGAARPVVER